MGDPILVPCLVALRAEFNKKYPKRDKGADGWIGDKAHQQESSDHNPDETGRTPTEDADKINEVHALDVDSNLVPGAAGPKALKADVERIRLAHLHGTDDRLQNIIYQGRITSRSWGWTWRDYKGASQHFDHAHFSARYDTSRENNTRPWGVLEDDDMDEAGVIAALKKWAADTGGLPGNEGRPNRSLAGTVNALAVAIGQDAERDGRILAAAIAQESVDTDALVEALAPKLALAILAGLPDGTITQANVEAGVRNVLQGANPAA
jgi:hypothetical protein